MNYIPEIAKLFGVEIGEEFKLKGSDDIYRFSEDGLLEWKWCKKWEEEELRTFLDLITGKEEIVKLTNKGANE